MADVGAGSGDGGSGDGEEKMVTLVSSDGARFEVREAAAAMADMGAGSGDGGSGSSDGEEKMVTLVTSDGARFEVREAAASMSQTVRRMIDAAGGGDGGGGGGGIPLPNVGARTLSLVLEYCNKHAPVPAAAPPCAEELEWFDREFVRVDMSTLHSLIEAAHHLKVPGLLELTCQTVADMLKGKTTEEMREVLGIQSDFTPEEEEEIRREHAWAFG